MLVNGLMQQIFVANPKGGCGKTMLSVHLASHFARKGLSVALCDHDPQRSSLDWLRARPRHLPSIEGIEFFQHQLISNRYDIAIHDAPAGHGADELIDMVGGHQLIIPVLPSATDIRACVRHLMDLNRSGVVEQNPGKIGLVANRVNLQTNYFKVLMTFLNEVNLPIVGYLRDTQNYIRAVNAGVSLFDLPPSAVKQDTLQWQTILEWLNKPSKETSNPLQSTLDELLGN
jgi:chromosome partitioning protein